MQDIKVSFYSKTQFTDKPNTPTAAQLSTIIAEKIVTVSQDDIKAFATLVGDKGCTFCPATFKNGTRNKESFGQTQFLALDFDNKGPDNTISFEGVKERADRYDLPMLFAYDTFSSRNHNKFRVVFLNDNPVSDIRAAETMLKALTTIFPEADKQCRSAVQMYFGGKGLLYYDDTVPEINIESVLRNTTNYLEDKYGATHYKRKLAEFSRDTGIALNEKGLLDVSVEEVSAETVGAFDGKNLPNSSIYVRLGRNLPNTFYRINYGENRTEILSAERQTNYHRSYRSDILRDIGSGCRLFREFESGEPILEHNELFGIATNLVQVESGESRFKELLREHPYYGQEQRYKKWVQDLRRIKGYKPYGCNHFCPYRADCPHSTNILSTVKPRYHQMERIANYDEQYVTLDEAWDDFNRKLSRAVESSKKGWHILKAQTALGKSQAILELLKDTSIKVLIAVPTNILKREIRERAKHMGIKLTASPSLHELKPYLPSYVWGDIGSLLNSGKPTMPYVDKLIREDDPECSAILKKYKRKQDAFKDAEGHAITTHKRLLTMDTGEYDLVIVDEDIIFNTIIPNKADISISDLEQLKNEVSPASPLARKIIKRPPAKAGGIISG